TRASVKPRILSNHSAGAPSPIRPVALAAAARSGSAFTSSLIFSNWPWSSSACKKLRKSSNAIIHSPEKNSGPAAILASAWHGDVRGQIDPARGLPHGGQCHLPFRDGYKRQASAAPSPRPCVKVRAYFRDGWC